MSKLILSWNIIQLFKWVILIGNSKFLKISYTKNQIQNCTDPLRWVSNVVDEISEIFNYNMYIKYDVEILIGDFNVNLLENNT